MASTKKVGFVDISTKELPSPTSYATSSSAPSGRVTPVDRRRLNPLEDLNQRLSVWDPNLPDFSALFGRYDTDGEMKKTPEPVIEAKVSEDDSPYEVVRAVVRNYDEDLPVDTVRVWVIGMFLVVFGTALNTVFSLRFPTIGVSGLIAQLISYVLGSFWYKVMPMRVFNSFGWEWTLNPGPFNIKEHTIIVVMANVAYGTAYATDIIVAQKLYKQDFGIPFWCLLMVTTQTIGYGIAGLMRKFLVFPAAMIWPTILPGVTLMYSLHERTLPLDPTVFGGNMSRYRWFFYVTGAMFIYYWIPGFLAQCLSIMAFVTWIRPNNVVINQLFGGTSGLSLLPLTLDWTTITGFVGSPLIPPWFAIANTLIGVVLFYQIIATGFHYSNSFFAQFLSMSDSVVYDNTGNPYNVTRVQKGLSFDEVAYRSYSPLFISTTFTISYGLSFAAISALIVHTYLYHGAEIMGRIKQWKTQGNDDIHMKLMRKYKEVPEWWYLSIFVVMTALSLVTILVFPTQLAVWALFLALAISAFFAIPIGMITAASGIELGLNVFTEFVIGYLQPGRPLAMMLFKTYGYITMSQGLSFVSDLKFGHYMKIPPRSMFTAQVVATIFSCFIQVVTLKLSLDNIPDVCDKHAKNSFTCPGAHVFYSASVIWGLIGPARIFSPGQVYSPLFWFFGIGAITPALFFFAAKRFPKSPIKYLHAPIIFSGSGQIPPATPLNYLSWAAVGWVFQYHIRRKHFNWWARLNYLTSAGLDLGLALSTILIFLAFQLHGYTGPKWWGNTVQQSTMDYNGNAVQFKLKEGQTFGPKTWR